MTDAWTGILDEGETILWQGQPDGALAFQPKHIFTMIFGIGFAGFALFWMVLAASGGGMFWMLGLLHFSAGLFIAFGTVLLDAYIRRRTWYTLTDRRAFIATQVPVIGRSLNSYPIAADTPLELSGQGLTTIHFATRRAKTKRGYRDRPVGFVRITDGETVLRLLRQIQRGETQ